MDLLLIRHALAVDREDWSDDDLLRPLTQKGGKAARAFFDSLSDIVPSPDRIVTSPAVRAADTAHLLRRALRSRKPVVNPDLVPGCVPEVIVSLARNSPERQVLAIVGHEPDLSVAAALLIGGPGAHIRLAKGACAWLRRITGSYELRMLVSPKQLG